MRGLEMWMIAAIAAVVVVAVVAGLVFLKKPAAPEKPAGPEQPQPGEQPAPGEQPPAGEEQPPEEVTTEADKITVVTTEDENHKILEDTTGYWGIDKVGYAIEGDKFTMEILVDKTSLEKLAEARGETAADAAEYLRKTLVAWLTLAGENIDYEVAQGTKYYKITITGTVKDAETLKKIAENIVLG